jgi:hypothetical protein
VVIAYLKGREVNAALMYANMYNGTPLTRTPDGGYSEISLTWTPDGGYRGNPLTRTLMVDIPLSTHASRTK